MFNLRQCNPALLAVALALFCALAVVPSHAESLRPLWLPSVRSLVFRAGERAVGRRSAVPQLECVGAPEGFNKPEYHATLIECRNVGSNGPDVEWRCSAQLHDDVALGEASVICEGFRGEDDDYVTPGSCSVEYTLVHSPAYLARQRWTNMVLYGFISLSLVGYLVWQFLPNVDGLAQELGGFSEDIETSDAQEDLIKKSNEHSPPTTSFGEPPEGPTTPTSHAPTASAPPLSEEVSSSWDSSSDHVEDEEDEELEQADPSTEPEDVFHSTSAGFTFLRAMLDGIVASARAPASSTESSGSTASTRRRSGSDVGVRLVETHATTQRRSEALSPAYTTGTTMAKTLRRRSPMPSVTEEHEEKKVKAKTHRRTETVVNPTTTATSATTKRREETTPKSTSTTAAPTKRREETAPKSTSTTMARTKRR